MMDALLKMISVIVQVQKDNNLAELNLLNFVVSDGTTTLATRYVWPEDQAAASLCYAEGFRELRQALVTKLTHFGSNDLPYPISYIIMDSTTCASFKRSQQPNQREYNGKYPFKNESLINESSYQVEYEAVSTKMVMVASEPVTSSEHDWVKLAKNTGVAIIRQKRGSLVTYRFPISEMDQNRAYNRVKRCLANCESTFKYTQSSQQDLNSAMQKPNQLQTAPSHSVQRRSMDPLSRTISSNYANQHNYDDVLLEQKLTGHEGAITKLCRGCTEGVQDERLFTAGEDRKIMIWSIREQRVLETLEVHQNPISVLVTYENMLISASGRRIVFMNMENYKIEFSFWTDKFMGPVRAVAYIKNTIYVSNCDNKLRKYVINRPAPKQPSIFQQAFQQPKRRQGSVKPLSSQFQNNETQVSNNGTDTDKAQTQNNSTQVGRKTLEGQSSLHNASNAFQQEQTQQSYKVFSAKGDQIIEYRETTLLEEHCGTVTCLKLYNDYVISAGSDGFIKVWDGQSLVLKTTLNPPHKGCVNSMYISNSTLFSVGEDEIVRVWDLESFTCRRSLKGHRDSILDISASFKMLQHSNKVQYKPISNINQSEHGDEQQFDLEIGQNGVHYKENGINTGNHNHHNNNNYGIQSAHYKEDHMRVNGFDSDSDKSSSLSVTSSQIHQGGYPKYLITCSQDRTIRIWNTKSWTCEQKFKVDDSYQVISCDIIGDFVVAGTLQGVILFWAIAFQKVIKNQQGLAKDIFHNSLAKSGTTSHFKIGSYENTFMRARDRHMTSQPSDSLTFNQINMFVDPRFNVNSITSPNSDQDLELELQYRLKQFISIPTVSQDSRYKDACHSGAKFLGTILDCMGAEVKLVQAKDHMNPVVLGRIQSDPNLPKVTFYGHYDVQPALESDWRSDPFKLSVVDGYMYGRGVSDNKGPILSFIYAVKSILKDSRRINKAKKNHPILPFNVAFLFEGEEENGSIGFQDVVDEYKHWFQNTTFSIISNTTWVGERIPCITYGLRGMITLRIEISGPTKNIHSGNDGGVFNEPMMDLLKILSTLVDSKSNILIPGFYDGVEDVSLDIALPRLLESSEFNVEKYKETLGVPELTNAASKLDLLRARWCLPCLSIVGITDGNIENNSLHSQRSSETDDEELKGQDQYRKFEGIFRYGPTQYSVIPKSKIGEISIRYVSGQDPQHLVSSIKKHVQHEFAKLRSKNTLQLQVKNIGVAWQAKNQCRILKTAEKIIEKEVMIKDIFKGFDKSTKLSYSAWGMQPLYVREGGTLSLAAVLESTLKAPVLMLPMGQGSDNYHLANERMRILNMQKGGQVFKDLLLSLDSIKTYQQQANEIIPNDVGHYDI